MEGLQTLNSGKSLANLRLAPLETLEDERQFSALLNQAFKVPKGQHFLDDFPVWSHEFEKPAQVRKLGMFQGPQLVAAVGVRFADVRSGAGRVPIAIIGAVVTDPLWRGIGLASKLIQQAVQLARNFEVAGVFLWGSEHQFYKKLGFTTFGIQARASLEEFPWINLDPTTPIRMGWNENIFPLLMTRHSGLALAEKDRLWVRAHKNIKWIWAGPTERPSAFAAYGKGIDLYGIVHEWGGDLIEVKKILSYLKRVDGSLQIIGTERNLGELGFESRHLVKENLCLAHILDSSRIPLQASHAFWFWGLDSA